MHFARRSAGRSPKICRSPPLAEPVRMKNESAIVRAREKFFHPRRSRSREFRRMSPRAAGQFFRPRRTASRRSGGCFRGCPEEIRAEVFRHRHHGSGEEAERNPAELIVRHRHRRAKPEASAVSLSHSRREKGALMSFCRKQKRSAGTFADAAGNRREKFRAGTHERMQPDDTIRQMDRMQMQGFLSTGHPPRSGTRHRIDESAVRSSPKSKQVNLYASPSRRPSETNLERFKRERSKRKERIS